jgi:hypothetical protein
VRPVRGRPGGHRPTAADVRNGRDVRQLAGHPPGVRPHPGHLRRAGRPVPGLARRRRRGLPWRVTRWRTPTPSPPPPGTNGPTCSPSARRRRRRRTSPWPRRWHWGSAWGAGRRTWLGSTSRRALPAPWARTRSAGCCAPPAGPARPGTGRCALLPGTGVRLAGPPSSTSTTCPLPSAPARSTCAPASGSDRAPVPLPADARSRLRRWLTERARHPAARRGNAALWLGRRGRLSARQLQLIVAELGADARLVDVSRAHPAAHRGDPPVTRTVLHQRNVDQPINGSNRYTPARTTGSTLSPTI